LLAVLSGHDERVSGVDVSPDGRWVLTTSWDHRARRWDLGVIDAPLPDLPALTLEAALQATAR
jgi:WD40 repeat protein